MLYIEDTIAQLFTVYISTTDLCLFTIHKSEVIQRGCIPITTCSRCDFVALSSLIRHTHTKLLFQLKYLKYSNKRIDRKFNINQVFSYINAVVVFTRSYVI